MRNSLGMQGTEGQECRGRAGGAQTTVLRSTLMVQTTDRTHTQLNTKDILPRTVVNLIFLAKRKTKYQWLGELKMHNETLPPSPLGYFDI